MINISWQVPENECSYNTTEIYRSATQTGTYTLIGTQSIDNTSYCDTTGSITSWYKIRFKITAPEAYSDYSDPMQGGTYLGYVSVGEVRSSNNLTSADITDGELYAIIQKATAYLNAEINQRIIRERIFPIDETRTNKIDGVNTTYYVKHYREHIGDMNNDGKVTTDDLIVYQVDANNIETQLTVSSISPDEGYFVLSSAPDQGVKLFVTYEWCWVSEYQPHALVKLACENLSSSLAIAKIERGMSPQQVYGNVRIYRDMTASSEFHKTYREIVTQINSEMIEWKQSPKTF
jgi:hypothetical protein